MNKIIASTLLLLAPMAAWSKSQTVHQACKQVIAMTSEKGMLHVVDHIKKCYADNNTAVSSNKQKIMICAAKHITAIHLDTETTTYLGYPPNPFLTNEEGSNRIHQELIQSGISRSADESIAIMGKLNDQVKPCLR